jgi:hypothetical protein
VTESAFPSVRDSLVLISAASVLQLCIEMPVFMSILTDVAVEAALRFKPVSTTNLALADNPFVRSLTMVVNL